MRRFNVVKAVDPHSKKIREMVERWFADLRARYSELSDEEIASLVNSLDVKAEVALLSDAAEDVMRAEIARQAKAYTNKASWLKDGDRDDVARAFSIQNPFVIKQAQRSAALLVKQISEATRSGVKTIIEQGIEQQRTMRATAKEIRSVVGLTSQQATALDNYRRKLEEMGAKNVDEKTVEYGKRLLRDRSLTIARTENSTCQNGGILASVEEAQAQGFAGKAQKRWIAGWGSERTCPTCGALHNVEVDFDEAFPGGFMAPPAHVSCRCTVGPVFRAPGANVARQKRPTTSEIDRAAERYSSYLRDRATRRRRQNMRGVK